MIYVAKPLEKDMTEAEYTKFVGRPPIQDDLERVNCKDAGKHGHSFCGWNACKNMPMFMSQHHKDGCSCKK